MEGQYYIGGEFEGIPMYLKIDFYQDYKWTEDAGKKLVGSFEEMCEILDEHFSHGELNAISGIISPVDAKV